MPFTFPTFVSLPLLLVGAADHANSSLPLALKTALARIVRTFGAKLSAFRFPPVVAAKIQGWIDVVGV